VRAARNSSRGDGLDIERRSVQVQSYTKAEEASTPGSTCGEERIGGFTQIPNAVLYDAEISMQARALYTVLLSYAWDGPTVWPGFESESGRGLTDRTGWGEHTIRKYLRELQDAGLVEIKREGRGRTNIYRLKEWVAPKGEESQPSTDGLDTHKGAVQEAHPCAPEEHVAKEHKAFTPSEPIGSPGDAEASPETPKKAKGAKNWFTTFCQRIAEVGLVVTPEHRKRLPRNLKRLQEDHGATEVEMAQVVAKLLEAELRSYPKSPQEALNEIRGGGQSGGSARSGRPKGSGAVIGAKGEDYYPEGYGDSPTPQAGIEALKAHDRLSAFACYAEHFDFSSDREPSWQLRKKLGNTDLESHSNLTSIRSLVKRAVRQAEVEALARKPRRSTEEHEQSKGPDMSHLWAIKHWGQDPYSRLFPLGVSDAIERVARLLQEPETNPGRVFARCIEGHLAVEDVIRAASYEVWGEPEPPAGEAAHARAAVEGLYARLRASEGSGKGATPPDREKGAEGRVVAM
jgi:DNA-binding transcriptional ArsR family regulator